MTPYTAHDSLLSSGRIGEAAWSAALGKRCGPIMAAQVSALYHVEAERRGLNPDLAIAQACEECAWFTSGRWLHQRNPCGLGITSDDVIGVDFKTSENGIRAHLDHLCCYAYGADCPVDMFVTSDPRHNFHDGNPALSHLQDETRKWATKPGYVGRILAIANAVLAASDAPGATKGPTMALQTREAIIPATNANRPKLPMVPKFITIHETANPNKGANAEMHRKFLVNGGGPEGVSFHWVVDDREAVHLIPDNEVAWHAGDGANGPGNRQSIAIETCVNSDGNTVRTTRHLIELVALLMARHGIPLANVVQHNHWSGKDCPALIRKTGQWTGLKAAISLASRATPAPPTGSVRHYLNPQGETIIEVNMGGKAVEILGVNLVDIGVSVRNEAGAIYDRSIIGNEFREWVKR